MSNKDLYRAICEQKKDVLPVFMQAWWLDVVCNDWDAAIAKKGDMVSGAWPFPVERKMGVTLLRTPLLTPYLGPCFFPPADIKDNKVDNFQYEAISDLISQLPKAKVWHLALKPGIKQAGIFNNLGLKPMVQQTFLVMLSEKEETLLSNMRDNYRRNVRIAEKEISICNDPGLIEVLYLFQMNTLKRKGKSAPYSLKYVQTIMDACLAQNCTALWVAKMGDVIQAIVWEVWDEHCSYYFMGGQNPGSNNYKAMTLLLWHAIKEAKKRGNAVFDFEGSMDEGVERFFRNFGGNRELYMVLHRNGSFLWKLKDLVLG
jgi:lipid II:glycine glycyltransferase (peptidoglycan interpeptide bridge formation enzyme)